MADYDRLRIGFLSNPDKTRRLIEALHEQNLDQERLFQLIAGLANLLDKVKVIETVEAILGIKPVEKDGCVLFDDIAIKFDDDGRVVGLYRTIDGTTEPARTIIKNLTDDGSAT